MGGLPKAEEGASTLLRVGAGLDESPSISMSTKADPTCGTRLGGGGVGTKGID